MRAVRLHSKDEIEAFLRRNTSLHLYALGDLDDFFWQYTTWYALRDFEGIQQLILLYTGSSLPVLLALAEEPMESMQELLRVSLPYLPRRFYAHLSGDLATVFTQDYHVQSHGLHDKMDLVDPTRLNAVDTSGVVPLKPSDLPEMEKFYAASYPGNWFDARMVETGCYFGIRRGDALASVAGVHVYSERYRVAALGNITTRPDLRGQGLGARVCTRLCEELLKKVDHIGLNVKADNAAAIACYKKIGFEKSNEYEELTISLKIENID